MAYGILFKYEQIEILRYYVQLRRLSMNYSSTEFESKYTYTGTDLGAVWTREKTAFRVWAPTASAVRVNLYRTGDAQVNDLLESLSMNADVNGTWFIEKSGDLNGIYYTYSVTVAGNTTEACDPYARTTGVNGNRAMVIDLVSTNPAGWDTDTDPNAGKPFTDAVIYELHIRDLSIDESSGHSVKNKGKYLGVIEPGTATKSGIPTGLDHMKNLGITHLHILPMYDFGTVDEYHLDRPQFNWGYDPVNYNVPEGSYSSDPFNGAVRVAELKQMVKGLHDNGISVVMDVVYNHVYEAKDFCFNQIVPYYFSRTDSKGKLSDGSCCGNDTASERSMVRKYIVDSVKYWADEYHIDGFRFDLVGLIDTVTVNSLMTEVHKTHPHVVFYGEGWDMETTLSKKVLLTTKDNASAVPGFAFFSDTIRDLLKGSVFDNTTPGFVTGVPASDADLWRCFMGIPAWCPSPLQTVNYVSCHDNNTLIDRIALSTPKATQEERIRMNNLAAAFCLTAQGIPFFQAGEEMLRSKPLPNGGFEHNSFRSSDEINSIKWNLLDLPEYRMCYAYYQGLIAFRKAHKVLRLTTAKEALAAVSTVATGNPHALAFRVKDGAEDLFLVFNADTEALSMPLPKGKWNVCIKDGKAGTETLETVEGTIRISPITAMALVKA